MCRKVVCTYTCIHVFSADCISQKSVLLRKSHKLANINIKLILVLLLSHVTDSLSNSPWRIIQNGNDVHIIHIIRTTLMKRYTQDANNSTYGISSA